MNLVKGKKLIVKISQKQWNDIKSHEILDSFKRNVPLKRIGLMHELSEDQVKSIIKSMISEEEYQQVIHDTQVKFLKLKKEREQGMYGGSGNFKGEKSKHDASYLKNNSQKVMEAIYLHGMSPEEFSAQYNINVDVLKKFINEIENDFLFKATIERLKKKRARSVKH
jgi:hypothetical protein